MHKPLLVAMCGLPGSGKTRLSRALAERLGALRWDKDELRGLLFPAASVEHDRALNDFCMEMLYGAVQYAFHEASPRASAVILDGRPFMEKSQRRRVSEAAGQAGAGIAFVLCTAPIEVLRERVVSDHHIAPDRNAGLVERLMADSEPFDGDEIRIDTSVLAPDEAVFQCTKELAARGLIDPVYSAQQERRIR